MQLCHYENSFTVRPGINISNVTSKLVLAVTFSFTSPHCDEAMIQKNMRALADSNNVVSRRVRECDAPVSLVRHMIV